MNWLLTRRNLFRLSLAIFSSTGACAKNKFRKLDSKAQGVEYSKTDLIVVETASLKKNAAAKGLIYGAATGQKELLSDAEFRTKFVQNSAIIAPPNDFKWAALRPTPNTFNFTTGDWFAKFAHTHSMLLRGHTLVWHHAIPKWFQETVTRQNAEKFLTEHIATVTRHYAGQMHSWDVVNEAIEPDDKRSDGLRITPWLKLLGSDYIELAFRVAAEADPKVLLVYNDYGLEYDYLKSEPKRTAVLRLLERLKSKGTPIHALGIQSHLTAHSTRFNPDKLRKFLGDVASLGLKIMITELDVIDKKVPVSIAVRDRMVAAAYEDYLSVVLDEKAVIAVITWGLSDRYILFSKAATGPDRARLRPLPLDSNLKRKPAWYAIAKAFDHAPKR